MAVTEFEIEDGVLKAYHGSETEITIPEGVHTIADGALKGLTGILAVHFPTTLRKLGNAVFKGCRQLKKVSINEGLEEIGEYAFHRCHQIEELIFPKTMTRVGNYAFLYCDGLRRVVMQGPKHLGNGAFSHNLALKEIALNHDVDDANFSAEVFEGCVHLRQITLGEETYEVENLIEAMDSHAVVPLVIKSIAKSVYHSMKIEDGVLCKFSINLKNITLPEGITAIGKSCFFDKKGIVSITLPQSLQEVRANAFLNCSSLEEIIFPKEEILLDEKAFCGCCHLKQIVLNGTTYRLENETDNDLISRIRDQVTSDFYISGNTLIRYMGDEEQIEIPKEVRIIGERCFFGKEQLKTVLCPEGLVEIREQAFAGCLTLQSIALPEGLKRVEKEAFAECKKLLKCNVPASLEYIGEYAFRRCFTLKPFDPWPEKATIHPYAFYQAKHFPEVPKRRLENRQAGFAWAEIADGEDAYVKPHTYTGKGGISKLTLTGVKRIGKWAYSACQDLEEVEIDAPECVIERNAFAACPKLRKVRLHVKEMEDSVFSYCRALEEVVLSGMSVLPERSFIGCYALSRLEAGEITRMEERCFDECIRLDGFDFSGVCEIGDRAFERCDSLHEVKLDHVVCGYHAFADCASLKSIELTGNTVLKSEGFVGCTQAESIIYDSVRYDFARFADGLNHAGNPYPGPVREVIASIWACYDIRDRKILTGYSQFATEVTIPQDVEEVGQDVFRDHARIKMVHIPKTVKTFGSHAFFMTTWMEEQRALSDLVIVNHILLDGANCKGSVTIPDSVKRVAGWCFAGNTQITELTIPSDRIGIENLAFRNCLNLRKITDWNGTEYTLESFSDLTEKGYPALIRRIFSECINCFKLDENANLIESTGNITKLTFPEGIRSIGDAVYQDCHLLEQIDLSRDTQAIGKSAFENSKWLKRVTNAGSVTTIGAQAFSGCQSLESIDVSECLCELGKRCFEHCGSLQEICLTGALEVIPERAFFRCKSLTMVKIAQTVKMIEAEAFAFCENLEEVQVPANAQIADNAFAFCEEVHIVKYTV